MVLSGDGHGGRVAGSQASGFGSAVPARAVPLVAFVALVQLALLARAVALVTLVTFGALVF